MDLDFEDGINLTNEAIKKQQEQKDWELYLSIYPNMDKNTFIPFEKFRSKNISSKKTEKVELTSKELIEKAESIKKLAQGKHEGVTK